MTAGATRGVDELLRAAGIDAAAGVQIVSVSRLAAIAFDLPSREAVDALVARAEAAGATLDPVDDYGFMYQQGFDDPDGNHFEPFWADPAGPSAD